MAAKAFFCGSVNKNPFNSSYFYLSILTKLLLQQPIKKL